MIVEILKNSQLYWFNMNVIISLHQACVPENWASCGTWKYQDIDVRYGINF